MWQGYKLLSHITLPIQRKETKMLAYFAILTTLLLSIFSLPTSDSEYGKAGRPGCCWGRKKHRKHPTPDSHTISERPIAKFVSTGLNTPVVKFSPVSDEPRKLNVKQEIKTLLEMHSRYRRKHNVQRLTYSSRIARQAAEYASKCEWKHSETEGFGENLYVSSETKDLGIQTAKGWYDEITLYDYQKPYFSHETGHFTQMIWADSKSIGCGISKCPASMMKGWEREHKYAYFVVCQYSPPGNVQGEFAEKVTLPSS